MYGKLFQSMYDGTIRDDWRALVTLQQLVILANPDGCVLMTENAIIARTGIPADIITPGLRALEATDPKSRTSAEEGRRVIALEPFGWLVVNYKQYRELKDSETVRAQTRERVRRHRERANELQLGDETVGNDTKRSVTLGNGPKRQGEGGKETSDGSGFHLTLNDGTDFEIPQTLYAEYLTLYPAVDVNAALKEMRGYFLSNPTGRKTRRGILTAVNRRLSTLQDRAKPAVAFGGRKGHRSGNDERYKRDNPNAFGGEGDG